MSISLSVWTPFCLSDTVAVTRNHTEFEEEVDEVEENLCKHIEKEKKA